MRRMKLRLSSPIAVWLVLVVATFSAYLFQLDAARGHARLVGTAILVIAFFKIWLIGMRYMELDHAPLPLRLVYEMWIMVVGGALAVLFWMG